MKIERRFLVLPICIAMMFAGECSAGTLPLPTYEEPSPPTKSACKKWSLSNPDREMYQTWGAQDFSPYSEALAKRRLYEYCLTKKIPEIVEVNSLPYQMQKDWCAKNNNSKKYVCRNI